MPPLWIGRGAGYNSRQLFLRTVLIVEAYENFCSPFVNFSLHEIIFLKLMYPNEGLQELIYEIDVNIFLTLPMADVEFSYLIPVCRSCCRFTR